MEELRMIFLLFLLIMTFQAQAQNSLSYHQPFFPYYSQSGQDKFLIEEVFKNQRDGIFVDIGAHDGISFSNSYYFEKKLNWRGACIEPHPDRYAELKMNRKAQCVQACVSDFNGTAQFLKISGSPEMLSGLYDEYDQRYLDRIAFEIATYGGHKELININVFTLATVLKICNIKKIDLLCIDTEGSEYTILKSIEWDKIHIKVIVVENNFNDPKFESFLAEQGYKLIKQLEGDQIYRKNV